MRYGTFGPCDVGLRFDTRQGMNQESPLRILVVDDFAEWRARIRSLLQAQPEWQVVGEASDGLEAAEKATKLRPDIVVLDIGMPRLGGIEAAKRIRRDSPGSRIIFVTQENDADIRIAALATGAEGYLLKASAWNELVPAVEAALRDGHDTRALMCD
jgi:DNA-binding NarL/FixJ family response regulator